jgi:hypothetical protein
VRLEVARDGDILAEADLGSAADWRRRGVAMEAMAHLGSGSPEPELVEEGPLHWPGEGSLAIVGGAIQGNDGRERGVFQPGDPLVLALEVEVRRAGRHPLIPVAVLYRIDGIQILTSIGDGLTLGGAIGRRHRLSLGFDPLNLARGRYVFAAALYRTLDSVAESEYYDLVERCYEFEVRDDRPFRDGIFDHPATWTLG